MADKPVAWPTHGRAVNARNDTAEHLLEIMRELDELLDIAERGEVTRLELSLSINRMRRQASASLMLMIQQGAPIHPDRLSR